MSWKQYKEEFTKRRPTESHYIIGIDVGAESSSLAFYNTLRDEPEVIDLSGGYGRSSSPSVIQYVPESEWVYGEYALLNNGDGREVTVPVLDKLGGKEYISAGGRIYSANKLLGQYIKELLRHVRNINPRAEIAGIVCSVGAYVSQEVRDELTKAFAQAGQAGMLITLADDRDCVLARVLPDVAPAMKVMIMDYAGRELRAGIYSIKQSRTHKNTLEAETEAYLFDESLGMAEMDIALAGYFDKRLRGQDYQPARLKSFLYQHKNMLLQKSNWQKPLKMYPNFIYPPVQISIGHKDMQGLIAPFRERFLGFMSKLAGKGELPQVYCVGGGFEMQWVKEEITALFKDKAVFFKNPKSVAAEGAAKIAAKLLGVSSMWTINVIDKHQLKHDIGVVAKTGATERFIPIIYRGAFWWQKVKHVRFILAEQSSSHTTMELFTRDDDGRVARLTDISLNLPTRPKYATCLELSLSFSDSSTLNANVIDLGLGEIYPRSGFSKTFKVGI
ncbi:MAG: DUF5716 family protein [Clostridiales bacterium]|nr:DUF5716 family protein [Clostridiales bacterium]